MARRSQSSASWQHPASVGAWTALTGVLEFFSSGKDCPMMALNTVGAAVLFFCGTLPVEDVVVESVDLIEINHCYDGEGKHVFDQILFYDWSTQDRQYHVRAWRMLKHPSQVPHRDSVTGLYEATWYDSRVLRRVLATTVRETWTQYDPEVAARSQLPKELRRELLRPTSTFNFKVVQSP
jgi:hypothetical protein